MVLILKEQSHMVLGKGAELHLQVEQQLPHLYLILLIAENGAKEQFLIYIYSLLQLEIIILVAF